MTWIRGGKLTKFMILFITKTPDNLLFDMFWWKEKITPRMFCDKNSKGLKDGRAHVLYYVG